MPARSPDRYERVRRSLLHISLRQLTEEPGPDQTANFARRRARFKRHREELAEYRASQSATRVAAQERADGELRSKLDAVHSASTSAHPRPSMGHSSSQMLPYEASRNAADRIPSKSNPDIVEAFKRPRRPNHHAQRRSSNGRLERRSNTVVPSAMSKSTLHDHNQLTQDAYQNSPKNTQSDLVDRTRTSRLNAATPPTSTATSLPSSSTVAGDNSLFNKDATGQGNGFPTARSLSESPLFMSNYNSRPSTRASSRLASQSRAESVANGRRRSDNGTGRSLGPSSDGHIPSSQAQEQGANCVPTVGTPAPTHPGCTSKHFRIRCITGRQSIDGDTYYGVSWKSSWVPSDLVKTGDDGQQHCINIDGKDWLIAKTIKHKVKKGVPKQLVQWVDDTVEPARRLQRALEAIREFELKPRLSRRVVTFDESLLDHASILPQTEEDFRKAQVHLAKIWPMIAPRNDIDLLPAFRQIMLEQYPRPDDNTPSRKTHQVLIDRPQVRRLRWNDEYLLSGRFYDCRIKPRCNALLLQVVAEDEKDGHCPRCVTDIAPFRGCVRDTSEESPWFNGACVNCGAAEMNSTCVHHLIGTAHLERGRSNGLKSERLRELIDPSRSIDLFQNLDFEQDDDSDTYSADSYAESDCSSVYNPKNADDDHLTNANDNLGNRGAESINNNFQVESARSEEIADWSDGRSAKTGSNRRGFAFDTHASKPSGLHSTRGDLRVQLPSMRSKAAVSPTIASPRGIKTTTGADGGAGDQQDESGMDVTPARLDFSSVTLPPDLSATSQRLRDAPRFHDEGNTPDELYDVSVNGNMHSDSEPVNSREMTPQGRPPHYRSPRQAETTPDNRTTAIQSIEESIRRAPHAANVFNDSSSTESPQLPSVRRQGRKRAASRPSQHDRASSRLTTESSRSSGSVSHDSETAIKIRDSVASTVSTTHQSASEKKLDRGSMHDGCRVNRPCVYPDNLTAHIGPPSPVYRDIVDDSHTFTLGEVQFILSHATCHWASAFTRVWNGWREEGGSPFDSEDGKAQFLLSTFPEELLRAAKECCPTDPDNRVVITID